MAFFRSLYRTISVSRVRDFDRELETLEWMAMGTEQTEGVGDATTRRYMLRVKSLLSYAHKLRYTHFNAGATIKVRSDSASRGATLAKRIITPAEVALLNARARQHRNDERLSTRPARQL